jgi:hypothetical protein
MFDQKKRVILTTYLGLIPFYTTSILEIFNYADLFFSNILNFEKIPFIYGSIIVSFLSGMQWQKMIQNKITNRMLLPLFPLILVVTYDNEFFKNYSIIVIMFSMFLSLLIDILVLKKINEIWFKKLRVNATILASISYLI